MYYAIIGDIINSKTLKDRLNIQNKLANCLHLINQEYQDEIAADFTITLGDEFQGLLKRPKYLFEMLSKIEITMYPLKIRFGIGIGEILTKINRNLSLGSDGPCWWHARDMINDLKQNHKGLRLLSNIKISGIKDQNILNLINVSLSLCYSIKNNWTKDQKKVTDFIILNYGLTDKFIQKKIAESLNLSPVNINKKLKLSLFYDLIYSLQAITKILE